MSFKINYQPGRGLGPRNGFARIKSITYGGRIYHRYINSYFALPKLYRKRNGIERTRQNPNKYRYELVKWFTMCRLVHDWDVWAGRVRGLWREHSAHRLLRARHRLSLPLPGGVILFKLAFRIRIRILFVGSEYILLLVRVKNSVPNNIAREVWPHALQMRYQCCGSVMFIPDPNFFHPGSRVKRIPDPDPHLRICKLNKLFRSSRKYDLGFSSRIRILFFTRPGSQIPDPGVKKAADHWSRIRIRNTRSYHCIEKSWNSSPLYIYSTEGLAFYTWWKKHGISRKCP